MKKALFLVAAMLSLTVSSIANPVDVNSAKRVATNFLRSCNASQPLNGELTDISSLTPFSEFYIFTFENGFIIVAGDDCVTPILAYSTDNIFQTEKMPAHIKDWLQTYEEQIAFYRNIYSVADATRPTVLTVTDARSMEAIRHQWEALTTGGGVTPPLNDAVSPLLTTTWSQDPYYNNSCPYDNSYSEYAVAGCVATATAQIMKYWNHPTTGYGSHSYYHDSYGTLSANFGNTTYNWANMPNSLSAYSSATQVNAVATLIYHVGVAVDMNYSTVSSGAVTTSAGIVSEPSAENALKNYFKYSPLLHSVSREDYSDAEWCNLLYAELNAQRPILYSGRDSTGGHAFVLDGYNNNGQFHINWGWGSWCDGYYTMGDLHPASGGTGGNSSYTFNLQNHAVVGIQPNSSFGSTTTVTATSNNSGYGSVSGSGTYSLGDTVYLYASANSGYRLSQWSDGSHSAYRELVATGGTISLTAQFEPLTGDTLAYCGGAYLSCLGSGNGSTWGIKLPTSVLSSGHDLKKVQIYIPEAGTYSLTVYSGTSSPTTTEATFVYNASSADAKQWNTITLGAPVAIDATKSIWIAFTCNNANYPCAMGYCSGNSDAMLWSSSFYSIAGSWNYSWLIRAIFESGSTPGGDTPANDTLSYCGNNTYTSSVGVNSTTATVYWGIRIPASQLAGRNSISNVLLYVPSGYGGTYNMSIYQGGTTAPQTLLHSQSYSFTTNLDNWQVCIPSSAVSINSTLDLWVTFSNTGVTYPASGCPYVGDPNSDWISLDGTTWSHCYGDYSLDYSWMIKCITSSGNAAPSVHIDGPTQLIAGEAATFTASATAGTAITWSLAGATPSTGAGSSVTATWANSGTYNVVASATNSNGTGHDTLVVSVMGCNAITSFPYTMGFEDNENLGCWHLVDSDGDGYNWMLQSITNSGQNSMGSASYINSVGALTPDNWMIMPQMELTAGNSYELSWYTGIVDVNYYAEHYGVYVSTTGLSTSDFTLVEEYTIADTVWTHHTLDLSSYAGQTVYIAFRHFGTTDIYWMLIDDIAVTEQQAQTHLVSFTCTGNGDGTVSSSDFVGTLNSLCGLSFELSEGVAVTLFITPSECSQLEHFYVNNNDVVSTLGYTPNGGTQRTYTLVPTAETSVQAVFTKQTYTITASAEPSNMGSIEGAGTYNCGSTATLRAVPSGSGYRFVRWMDNSTENPRNIQVTEDRNFVAYFESVEGIGDVAADQVAIYPNPTSGSVTISSTQPARVEIFDMTGRMIFNSEIRNTKFEIHNSQFPTSGVYVVLISTEQSTTTEKLIVK